MQPACLSQSGLHALVVEPKDKNVRRAIDNIVCYEMQNG